MIAPPPSDITRHFLLLSNPEFSISHFSVMCIVDTDTTTVPPFFQYLDLNRSLLQCAPYVTETFAEQATFASSQNISPI
jgi:hypothetical protein